jgi:hypothetical protein
MEMNATERNYLVEERVEKDIKEHGIEKLINFYESELKEMEDLWGMYSSDCLGHGITCTRLKLLWAKRLKNEIVA